MLECHCGKQFETYRQLNGHKSSHNRGETYAEKRKSETAATHTCLKCREPFPHSYSSENKFCSMGCFARYQWEDVSIPNILAGKGGKGVKRYLQETVGDCCAVCGQLPLWNNKPLSLQVDHIDGNSDNNDISNLRLLCPNCHTQTDTYGSKGNGNRYKKVTKRNKYLQDYKASVV